MNGTPWGFIHQKRRADELGSEKHQIEQENQKLKEIIKKLLAKQELTNQEKDFLKELKLV